jgi:aminopeptidase N
MRGFVLLKFYRLAFILAFSLSAALSVRAQTEHRYPFRATNYDVEAILHPENQTISALVKADFVASEVAKTILVELHPDLHLNSVKAGSQNLNFERDNNSPLFLSVGLPSASTPGTKVTLTFDYTGPISSEQDSPTRGVRFASVDKTSAYLLLPSRWFPLTNYPSNRYTGTFKIIVPDSMAVAGTGKSDAPTMMPAIAKGMPGQAAYVFHNDTPAQVGSFVAGSLQLTPVQSEGYQFAVYTNPAQVSTATPYGNSLARIMSYFSESFGGLPNTSLTVAQMPDGSLNGFSAPGLLLISQRQWSAKPNDRLLSQLAAGQWWGNHVEAASFADTWLTDGMSRYAEAMYAEQSDGIAGMHKALEDFAVGALMYEGSTPISQAQRLGPYSDQYESIVGDKGAMVFHMLRTELGDDNFTALLRDFYKQHDGKTATIDDFQKLTATKIPPPKPDAPAFNLLSFYSQWLNSTGVPEFSVEYIVYRTPKGFRVVGKAHQALDTFRMPVDVKVETEGNPETKRILLTGTTSSFVIETFGRPKPNGITIDPNNNLLKSSPQLRTRASVARGENLAQAGKYFEAIQEYQKALDVQPTYSYAHFRMAEAMFYQKNYQAAANAFRSALGGDGNPKWTEVWSHIYMGKIYDLLGQRERAVNEYSLAQHTRDDTAGAQEEAGRWLKTAYNGDNSAPPGTATASVTAPATAPTTATGDTKPVLKRRDN